jgi:TetR/AcrR family transcriptional regulator, transcriptional repressor for nem operon
MMRYKPHHKAESRNRILQAAGRGFLQAGMGGIGVDGLAQEAGVTSGAFYGHFSSKKEAFREALVSGLESVREGVLAAHTRHGDQWVAHFAAFYLGVKRTCALGDSCALALLSAEVERTAPDVRAAYATALDRITEIVAERLPQFPERIRRQKAFALLGLLAGGLSLARAVPDAKTSAEIAQGIIEAAVVLVEPGA